MRVSPMLIAASSALLVLGTRQSLARPHEPIPGWAAWSPAVTAAGIPRFPARPPRSELRGDSLRLRLRLLGAWEPRECPMPVSGFLGDTLGPPRATPAPASMPVAPSACVNPLAR